MQSASCWGVILPSIITTLPTALHKNSPRCLASPGEYRFIVQADGEARGAKRGVQTGTTTNQYDAYD